MSKFKDWVKAKFAEYDEIIADLRAQNTDLRAQNTDLRAQNADLHRRVQNLEDKVASMETEREQDFAVIRRLLKQTNWLRTQVRHLASAEAERLFDGD